MNATELRIGNLIKAHTGEYAMVIHLHSDDCIGYDINGTDFSLLYAPSIDDMFKPEPIPLTPEILEKSGWKYVRGNGYMYLALPNSQYTLVFWRIKRNPSFTIIHEDDRAEFSVDIKYLHQLQNLYFALVGEELEITL